MTPMNSSRYPTACFHACRRSARRPAVCIAKARLARSPHLSGAELSFLVQQGGLVCGTYACGIVVVGVILAVCAQACRCSRRERAARGRGCHGRQLCRQIARCVCVCGGGQDLLMERAVGMAGRSVVEEIGGGSRRSWSSLCKRIVEICMLKEQNGSRTVGVQG